MKKRFIWLGLFVIIGALVYIYSNWVFYLLHHVRSHIGNIKNRYPISEILGPHEKNTGAQNENRSGQKMTSAPVQAGSPLAKKLKLSAKDIHKLKLIESVKSYGKKIYRLKDTDAYEKFVSLDREVLGKNLIVAEPLELKLKKFYFPFIGDFGYLGFFDFNLLGRFEKDYIDQGFDTYTSEIAAFTYLNYFKDPIFSTYLRFSDHQLTSLVMHEMAHVRLYFKDDTNFSEAIASFIETPAAQDYMETVLHKRFNPLNMKRLRQEYLEFNLLVDETKKKLKQVFQSDISPEEKRQRKKNVYTSFRRKLKKMSDENIYMTHSRLLKQKEINNAVLLQIARYNPPRETGLNMLFEETCQKNFNCWFHELEKLKACTPQEREVILQKKITVRNLLKSCKN